MKKTALFLVVLSGMLHAPTAFSQPFTLPSLPYTYAALEPYIDAQTMEIHHSKHHQAYVTNLNKAVEEKKLTSLSLQDLLLTAGKRGDAIRNNAGGHYNHSLFWEIMAPHASQELSPEFSAAVNAQFGSLDSLKKAINQAATSRFGSGWAWLVLTVDKKLVVTSTTNQDNPIMDTAAVRGIPVLGIDVWEHAYYLKYQNKRGDYLGAIWSVIDWGVISKKYSAALSDPLLKRIEKDSWKELTEFHKVMAQTFHPAEEGNLSPIRERSGEMAEKARKLQASVIPQSFNNNEIKNAVGELVKGADELDKLVKKKEKDAVIKEKLTRLHDTFHTIQGLCSH